MVEKLYNKEKILERHRHRYEVNNNLRKKFEKKGMVFSGMSPDNNLPEIVELKNHPWFVGVQFHPESILTEHGHQMLNTFLQDN